MTVFCPISVHTLSVVSGGGLPFAAMSGVMSYHDLTVSQEAILGAEDTILVAKAGHADLQSAHSNGQNVECMWL